MRKKERLLNIDTVKLAEKLKIIVIMMEILMREIYKFV